MINKWFELKGSNSVVSVYSDSLYTQQPLIQVQLIVTGERISLSPSLHSIHHLMEEIVDLIVNVSTEIPRVEHILLPGILL